MRIAIVTTFPPGLGSLNEYAHHFVRYLRLKPEVTEIILLVDELPEDQTYAPEEKLTFVPCWKFGATGNARRIRKAVAAADPDVVLFNIQFASFGAGKIAASLGLMAPILVKRSGYPTVVLLHNIMETVDLRGAGFGANAAMETLIRISGSAVTRMLLAADMVAVTIPKYVEILEAKYGARNVVLAPHGSFDDSPMPSLDLKDGRRQIMTFGKFGTYKKVDILVDAFRQLAAEGRDDLELVIAGTDSPNATGYLASVAAGCADLPNVRLTGYVAEENVPRVFGDAAVVVFPYTHTTGSSGVLHQAGDYAKAVVLPDIGDLRELVAEEGYLGEFFEPGDAGSLAAAIARLLDDPARRTEIATRNFMAARGIPIDEVIDWYLIHIDDIIANRGAAAVGSHGE